MDLTNASAIVTAGARSFGSATVRRLAQKWTADRGVTATARCPLHGCTSSAIQDEARDTLGVVPHGDMPQSGRLAPPRMHGQVLTPTPAGGNHAVALPEDDRDRNLDLPTALKAPHMRRHQRRVEPGGVSERLGEHCRIRRGNAARVTERVPEQNASADACAQDPRRDTCPATSRAVGERQRDHRPDRAVVPQPRRAERDDRGQGGRSR
jgi:hypothetical protein